ncbi:hypothetical protein GOP47_0006536 [Adiantum capillus-veneris]|uniref:FG-GAP repeat-containing protein n=1 Tax=Adiantum capillus-veneris TaxID=13818 RepID=A0A9D4ZN49_ADICA|nr:hypothetical protein GOP47_0006536 [Adiantum capillus-veneris]
MRKRDLAILLLSAFAIFFSLQNEGNVSFKEGWFHFLDESNPFKHEADRLPPPLVTDLNGDGRKEVLVATHDAEIEVLEPHHKYIDDGFSEVRVLAKVSLLPDKVRIAAGRLPVAMSAGSIQRTFRDGDVSKQVLVVVTAGWSVICYDHNLNKLWETDLGEEFPAHVRHKEVSILITNYTLKHGDMGLIIVGGSVDAQPQLLLDPFEEELVAEKRAQRFRHAAEEEQKTEDLPPERSGETARHMHYYAFAGRTGVQRWSHKTEDYHRPSGEAELIPQHNYKLDANSMNSRGKGEVECREFRESILGVMPHRWERREDTKFELAHFRKHKRKAHKQLPGRKSTLGNQKPDDALKPGKDPGNKLANMISKTASLASNTKSVKKTQYLPTITNLTQLWWVPNVLVAHLKEGIEAIHLASGRTVCKLLLQEGGLHADVNGDGVLDHVQAVGGVGTERVVLSGLMEAIRPCTAIATSGVPVREQLFNASICKHYPFGGFHHGFARGSDSTPLEAVTPVLLPIDDGHKHRRGSHGDLIFLNSRGEVTSYGPGLHGKGAIMRWQVVTGASWENSFFQAGVAADRIVPTLKVISLRAHGPPQLILVAGESEAAILSSSGRQLRSFFLPSAPTHELVVADFSGDGLNDIIVVASNGVYGFVQVQQPGALFFSSLVGCLIVVMCVIFIVQHFSFSSEGKKPGPR